MSNLPKPKIYLIIVTDPRRGKEARLHFAILGDEVYLPAAVISLSVGDARDLAARCEIPTVMTKDGVQLFPSHWLGAARPEMRENVESIAAICVRRSAEGLGPHPDL